MWCSLPPQDVGAAEAPPTDGPEEDSGSKSSRELDRKGQWQIYPYSPIQY